MSEIENSIRKNNNDKLYVVLIQIQYSLDPKIYICKLNNEHINFEKNSKMTIIESALNKLKEFLYEPRNDDIENLYNNKIYRYFLNNFDFYILKEKYNTILKMELKDFIIEFNLSKDVNNKINNLLNKKNQVYHEELVKRSKRKFQDEFDLVENLNRKIVRKINSQNPHMTIDIKQEIKIRERTTPFVFGFVGESETEKKNMISMFKNYLIEKGISEENIYITKGFQDIIDNMDVSRDQEETDAERKKITIYFI
ncbi:625_t:CDS:2 [Cetraspora pellucida]|uniref:625_t:CDS:1 n=1 Tax=Cetraspora pellucida TaxID=1433469 RepID=A0ACA9MR36_9GLOM|nr:625_t:CDS:2 [Cetraspora pellucida]